MIRTKGCGPQSLGSPFKIDPATAIKVASLAKSVLKMDDDKREDDPCWKDYEMVGLKTKNGNRVPNCVPK